MLYQLSYSRIFLRHKVKDFNVKNLQNKDLKHCFQQLSRGNAPLVFIKALTIKMLAQIKNKKTIPFHFNRLIIVDNQPIILLSSSYTLKMVCKCIINFIQRKK